ncbi:MAG: hypothetical protein QOD72_3224 [Acidimicrobiaceae bacterium]|jgi:uncharacterized membrane protein (DUF4010 family)|nr:hypothetical protein [Acidimicrobiaceae bacterium]
MNKLRAVAVAALLFAAVLFTVGVSREKSHRTETAATTPSSGLGCGRS